jgi:AraC-like DNA-binding protein
MHETLWGVDRDRLERSCTSQGDWIRFGCGSPGLERAEVHLATVAFEPHRHDTYALGITTDGVQTFSYRGTRHVGLPGQLHFLYPDELHDGAAGTRAGFGYRILYVAPELIRAALGGAALPFVTDPVQPVTPSTAFLAQLLADVDDPRDELAQVGLVVAVADALRAFGDAPSRGRSTFDERAVERVRGHLAAHAAEQIPASTLERLADADRFTIARQFRRAYGTSPDRYRTLRRVELARRAIERGVPLVRAAHEAGFADQAHMTRHFKRAYGLTPGRWARTVASAGVARG